MPNLEMSFVFTVVIILGGYVLGKVLAEWIFHKQSSGTYKKIDGIVSVGSNLLYPVLAYVLFQLFAWKIWWISLILAFLVLVFFVRGYKKEEIRQFEFIARKICGRITGEPAGKLYSTLLPNVGSTQLIQYVFEMPNGRSVVTLNIVNLDGNVVYKTGRAILFSFTLDGNYKLN